MLNYERSNTIDLRDEEAKLVFVDADIGDRRRASLIARVEEIAKSFVA